MLRSASFVKLPYFTDFSVSITRSLKPIEEGFFWIHNYENGIIERWDTTREIIEEDGVWSGEKIYPDGTIEKGRFEESRLRFGMHIKDGHTLYYGSPMITIGENVVLLTQIEYIPTIIVLNTDYNRIDIDLFPLLAKYNALGAVDAENFRDLFLPPEKAPLSLSEFVAFLMNPTATGDKPIFSLHFKTALLLYEMINETDLEIDFDTAVPGLIEYFTAQNDKYNLEKWRKS